ncbi:MAG: transcription factor S [Pyrodictiaceae archaeon]
MKTDAIARVSALKFCPQCGTMMILRRENGKLYWVCPNCSYREEAKATSNFTILKQQIKHSEKEKTVVIKEPPLETLPKTRAICPRCGYHEAYYWVVQTRRADEPPTRFFKCVRCGYVWREYD